MQCRVAVFEWIRTIYPRHTALIGDRGELASYAR